MNKPHAAPATWHPGTAQEREVILSELRQVLASPHFCNSKRYPALLEYVVEHVLAGSSEMLKERTLGVEVFGRRPDYDTNADTVVRYTASEVRKRLLLYYSELHDTPAVRISLPPGSYIPEFLRGGDHAEEQRTEAAGHGHPAAEIYEIKPAGETAEMHPVSVPFGVAPQESGRDKGREHSGPMRLLFSHPWWTAVVVA
ncbi:MAG TPA: hypothetical protein VF730_18110, partial [Terracidiphilus sp.]